MLLPAALRIHCSDQCKQMLDKLGGYILEPRGTVTIKVCCYCFHASLSLSKICAFLFMAALWNRAGYYIFVLWFLLTSFFLSFFPRLISAVAYWMSTTLPQKLILIISNLIISN